NRDLVGIDLGQAADDGFERALNVRLHQDRQFLGFAGGDLREHLLEGPAGTRLRLGIAGAALTELGNLARPAFAIDNRKILARQRRSLKAQDFHWLGWSGGERWIAVVVDEGAHPAPFGTGDENVADLQGAALDQHGCDRAAAAFELRLDDDALGRPLGV